MKKWLLMLAAAIFLGSASIAYAASAQTGNIYISPDEIVSGNLFVAGEILTIDGSVSGDVIAAAQKIIISGRVDGDIIAVAQEIIINGDVGGNVRIAGSTLQINGNVARNVNSFGSAISFGPNSRVGWDVYLAGENVNINGVIDGGLSGYAQKVIISGKIGKSVNLAQDIKQSSTSFIIAPTAIINGDLSYEATKEAEISSQASVAGEIKQIVPLVEKSNDWLVWAWKELFVIFSALVVGLAIIYIGKNITIKILTNMEDNPLKISLPGLALFLALPPLALIIAFSVIGIPLSIITISLWMILIYIGKIFSALVMGRLLLSKVGKVAGDKLIWPLVIGVLLIWLLAAIPYFGWLVSLSAAIFGIGGLWNYVYRERQNI